MREGDQLQSVSFSVATGRLRSCTQSARNLVVGGLFGWTAGPMLEVVEKYKETLKKYPNPPAANLTKF